MTPEEAKQRWCPFARVGAAANADPIPSANRAGVADPPFSGNFPMLMGSMCIADCCMAWRWSWTPEQAQKNYTKPSGYCGLAGAHGN